MEFLHVLVALVLMECGIALPSTTVHSVVPAREERDAEHDPLNISITIMNVSDNGTCYGGTSAGLGNTNLRLEYRINASDFQWVEIAGNIPIGGDFSTTYTVNISGSWCVMVRLVQEEHGGGNCNCWNLTDITFDAYRYTL